jgi:outer membrane protein OmpA-like peptidoglycan-associated protein
VQAIERQFHPSNELESAKMIARLRGSLSLLAFTAVLAVAPKASAQEQSGYAANHIDLSERGSRWFVLDSIDIQGNGRLALGVVNDFSYRPLVSYNSDGNAVASIVRNQLVMNLGGSIVLADRVRLGIGVPVQIFADGHNATINGVAHRAADDAAVGDVRLSLDGRLVGSPGDAASLALGVALFAPSGTPSAYTGDGKPRVEPRVAFAGRMSSFAYAAKLGFMLRGRNEAFGDGYIGSAVTGAVSAGVLLADDKLLVGPELFGSTVVADGRAFESRTTPLEALLGAHLDAGSNVRIGLAGGAGLTRGYGAPVARGLLSVEWVPGDAKPVVEAVGDDQDGDGIADCKDACSYVRGVASTDPAKNGCPLDSDSDGVSDDVDACPAVPGTASPDARVNGCPQDSDRDGVQDATDACPQEAGVHTNDPKTSGCPERDRDSDGVLDNVDACPDKGGPQTSDPKTNGCPTDTDRDKDGILNDADACPDEPGKPDPDPKKNGCPKAFLQGGAIKITDQVKFKTASAEIIGKDSDDVLNAVLGVLKAHPEVKALRVEGHTDNRGEAAKNKTLSQARAESVAKWLENHGIEKQRLSAAGLGAEKPIDSNDTEAGRTNNRRVEFHVEQGSGR